MQMARARIGDRSLYGEIEDDRFHAFAGGPFGEVRRSGEEFALAEVSLEAPAVPGKMLMMMGGWMPADGSPLPPDARPWLTPKIPSWVTGDGADIVQPRFLTKEVWLEPEIALVVGREIRNASHEEAKEAILGFTCFNDATASEFLPAGDWWRAKSIETFASMGPWLNTDMTEEDVLEGLRLSCRVNGETRVEANTSKLKFPVGYVLSFASHFTTMHPGDVISFGTPKPGLNVKPGDVCEIEVEGIGVLHNRVVAEGD